MAAVRFFQPEDLLNCATVAYSAFSEVSDFNYLRPFHRKHPKDALASLHNRFLQCISSDDYVCQVIELGGKIVGVALWRISTSSDRWGEFSHTMRINPRRITTFIENQGRDTDLSHSLNFQLAAVKAEANHLKPCHFRLELLAVDPLHQRKGYAKQLMQLGIMLAQADKTSIGVRAADEAVPFYKAMGFEHVSEFSCDPDSLSPSGVKAHIMVYSMPA